MTFYKATRPDGYDFYSGTVNWDRVGEVVRHPTHNELEWSRPDCALEMPLGESPYEVPLKYEPFWRVDFSKALSVTGDPMDTQGAAWPMRMFEVEPVGAYVYFAGATYVGTSWRVLCEVDPTIHFGKQGANVATVVEQCRSMTSEQTELIRAQMNRWSPAMYDSYKVACDASVAHDVRRELAVAKDAAYYAIRKSPGRHLASRTLGNTARGWADASIGHVLTALLVRNHIPQEDYDALTGAWRSIVGAIHPDDPESPWSKTSPKEKP